MYIFLLQRSYHTMSENWLIGKLVVIFVALGKARATKLLISEVSINHIKVKLSVFKWILLLMGKLDQICNFASSSYQNVPLFDALIYIIKLCEEHDFQYLCILLWCPRMMQEVIAKFYIQNRYWQEMIDCNCDWKGRREIPSFYV